MQLRPLSFRSGLCVLGTTLLAALAAWLLPPASDKPLAAANAPAISPQVQAILDHVPSDAGLFAHIRASEVWNHKIIKAGRQLLVKEIETPLKAFSDTIGLAPENVETVTFYYPQMPQGPGDEVTFVVAITTKEPYAKEGLFKGFRGKDAKEKDDVLVLKGDFLAVFPSDRSITVMHKSFQDRYNKGPIKDRPAGPMSTALKRVAEKHTFVAALNLPALPNEIFTAAPPELQPFLPLFKAKSATFVLDLDKDLRLQAEFACDGDDGLTKADQSLQLLVKLADEGLDGIIKDKDFVKEVGSALPLFKELHSSVKGVKIRKAGSDLVAEMSMKTELPFAAILKDAIVKITGAAENARAQNNLKQIALAMHNYHDANNGFPPAAIVDKKGKPLLSWRVAILPYIEQNHLYKQFKLDEPWDSEHNLKLAKISIKTYMIPGVTKPGESNYRLFYGNGAPFDQLQQLKLTDITDGSSNTIMVVEAAEAGPWTKPDDFEFDPKKDISKLLLFRNDRTNVAFCDGSVRSLGKKIAEATWKLLIQKNDGMVIPNLD